jgi:hypothetical protein
VTYWSLADVQVSGVCSTFCCLNKKLADVLACLFVAYELIISVPVRIVLLCVNLRKRQTGVVF